MRNVGVVAFTATVCALLPAATLHLTAGPAQEARLFAPSANALMIDGARVEVALDKVFAVEGETVHMKLTSPKAVSVGVVLLGSNGTEGGRVPSPPIGVAYRRTIQLKGGQPKDVAFELAGARTGFSGWYGTYTFYVMAPRSAEQLERQRRRTKPPLYNVECCMGDYDPAADKLDQMISELEISESGRPNAVARLEAYTHNVSPHISLAVPDATARDSSFTVALTITNPGKKPMYGVAVDLDLVGVQSQANIAIDADQVTVTPTLPGLVDLAPHETRRVEFNLKAATTGVLAVRGFARCSGEETEERPCSDNDALRLGAFEAVDIVDPPRFAGR